MWTDYKIKQVDAPPEDRCDTRPFRIITDI